MATAVSLLSLVGPIPAGAAVAAITRISARATPTTVPAGTSVVVTGTVTPRVAGVPVFLQRLNGRRWVTLRSLPVTTTGTFSTSLRTSLPTGTWALRVARVGSATVKVGFSATFTVVVRTPTVPAPPPPPLTITTATLPVGIVGRLYRAKLIATGGTGPYTWTAGPGGVPAGMGLTREGLLWGYPHAAGKVDVRIVARTAAGSTGAATLSIAITPPRAGKVLAWGENANGQLGNKTNKASAAPVAVGELSRIVAVASAGESAYALESDGALWSWGRGDVGRLGDGRINDRYSPVKVKTPAGITAVAAGGVGGYALQSDGTVWAWGSNDRGQFGNDTVGDSYVPTQVRLAGVVAIAGGSFGGYAIKGDGTVWAWGDNRYGQLGTGSTADRSLLPVQITRLKGIVALATGFLTTYALGADGRVWAWGPGGKGELGTGALTNSTVPVGVSKLSDATAIAAGNVNGYALRSDGTVVSWGTNTEGQLGNGTKTSSPVPVQVSGLTGVRAISGGGRTGYALTGGQLVMGWGDNTNGQLANPAAVNASLVPVQALGLPAVTAVDGGTFSAYAVTNEPV